MEAQACVTQKQAGLLAKTLSDNLSHSKLQKNVMDFYSLFFDV